MYDFLVGFGYEFNALSSSGRANPLAKALDEILNSATEISLLGLISDYIPAFQSLVCTPLFIVKFDDIDIEICQPTARNKKINAARKTMMKIGHELVAEKKAAILAADGIKNISSSANVLEKRDLLTLLMKGNMAVDIPQNQRLSDEEVMARE